ncbi:hypothetical protein L210DRAFT_934081 [Boletus edulis BED1]|uniref:Uncharacterized protein n=1 Tax=Boletus edulis BED1 TaxID=1328754 RepID=A0AAD4BJC4_BOLED|nr:hypothetical protein L210DRAFT_934081 [Boletus edulis BED1]
MSMKTLSLPHKSERKSEGRDEQDHTVEFRQNGVKALISQIWDNLAEGRSVVLKGYGNVDGFNFSLKDLLEEFGCFPDHVIQAHDMRKHASDPAHPHVKITVREFMKGPWIFTSCKWVYLTLCSRCNQTHHVVDVDGSDLPFPGRLLGPAAPRSYYNLSAPCMMQTLGVCKMWFLTKLTNRENVMIEFEGGNVETVETHRQAQGAIHDKSVAQEYPRNPVQNGHCFANNQPVKKITIQSDYFKFVEDPEVDPDFKGEDYISQAAVIQAQPLGVRIPTIPIGSKCIHAYPKLSKYLFSSSVTLQT